MKVVSAYLVVVPPLKAKPKTLTCQTVTYEPTSIHKKLIIKYNKQLKIYSNSF